ncbi:hypothetical protein [Streptomyces sp. NPDC047043]|uniref:hypothetical protein n=1 Tax=Streptomyces sp. NPDC047043 TaxID=3154497 RepID=UPI00340983E3
MWPGEQSPGGRPDQQQDANPYRQPGYQQPNPYQQQPWQAPTAPALPETRGAGRRTKVVALVAATVVVVTAAVTGAVLLTGGSDDRADPDPTGSASPQASGSGNPRASDGTKPTIAGWKVVANPQLGVLFDVPADWAPQSPSWVSYVSENDDPDDTPLVAMKAPAVLKQQWCGADDDKDGKVDYTSLASAGTRRNNGAKNTAEIARADSATWVYGSYTQPDHKKVTTGPVTSFTTASGLTGSVATSRSSGVKKLHKCASDGKATTFAFKNAAGDLASWSFVGARGVGEEVPDATVRKVLSTVRLYTPPEDS